MNTPVVRSAKTRSARHKVGLQRTREENAQETAQDYVEMIAELIAVTGEARVTDLARRLGVTHVTVNRTIQRLQRNGLVTALPIAPFSSPTPGGNSRRNHTAVMKLSAPSSDHLACRTPSPTRMPRYGASR